MRYVRERGQRQKVSSIGRLDFAVRDAAKYTGVSLERINREVLVEKSR